MFAFYNSAVVKLCLVVVGLLSSDYRTSAVTHRACASPGVIVSVSVASDTVGSGKAAKPAKPGKPVKITISDEGIKIGSDGKEKVILDIDTEDLINIDEEALKKIENLPESLEAVFGADEDRRFVRVKGSDLVQFGRTIRVGKDELVNGDVVTIGSDIVIEGKVMGDVAAIFGDVELGSDAIVNGEVVSILGSVQREDGAIVRGETAVIGGRHGHRGLVYPIGPLGEGLFSAGARIAAFIIGIFLVLIVLYFLGERMSRAATHASGSLLKSFGSGLLVIFGGSVLVVILTVILAITIVGIPVAVLLVLSFIALMAIGYFVSALALGRFLCGKFNIDGDSVYVHALIGLAALSIFGIAAGFMYFSPLLGPARLMLRVFSFCINFVAVAAGVGAFIFSRGGSVPQRLRAALPE